MKQYSKKLFSLIMLCSTIGNTLQANDDHSNHATPFIQFRSQGRDTSRKLIGVTDQGIYQREYTRDEDCLRYFNFGVTLQYDQSFRGGSLADCLFGNSLIDNANIPTTNRCDDDCHDDSRTLIISGLNQPTGTTRGAFEWMAENFYLPRNFRSAITFSPKVRDVVLDFNLFFGFNRWVNGMYFRLYGPVVWNKVSLRAEETVIQRGTSPAGDYPTGYFEPNTAVPATSLFGQALNFFSGCQLPTYPDQEVTAEPLRFAKFSDCNLATTNSCDDPCGSSNSKTGFAELRGELGWNYMCDGYRFLLNIQAAAPTGTRPNAEFLFPAYVGNGKHWELGVGLGGSWRMWCSEDTEKSFSFIVEADITHLFKAKQQRTFDLKGKPNSRYMLAQRLETIDDAGEQLIPNTPQFNVIANEGGTYSPVANFSTRDVKVSIGVQGDVVAMFNYSVRGFSWDLGYNFWGMSASKISLSDNCDDTCGVIPFPANTWALKGDASIAGFSDDGSSVFGLGATESNATIFTGTNVGTANPLANLGIDNPQEANANNGATPPVEIPLFVAGSTTDRINTSVQPVFISIDDLDINGAEQRGISHKIFTHFSYTWTDCCDRWTPYLGAGFSAEFGSHSGSDHCPNTTTPTVTVDNCPSSTNCALSKWAVEIKGGVSFH